MNSNAAVINATINELFWHDGTMFTSMSDVGHVRIPDAIRESLNITPNAPLIIMQDELGIRIVPLPKPSMEEFNSSMRESQSWAKEVGLSEQDIVDAIREVRKEKRARNSA